MWFFTLFSPNEPILAAASNVLAAKTLQNNRSCWEGGAYGEVGCLRFPPLPSQPFIDPNGNALPSTIQHVERVQAVSRHEVPAPRPLPLRTSKLKTKHLDSRCSHIPGDMNQDGFPDLVVGAYGSGVAGEAFVVFPGLTGTPPPTMTPTPAPTGLTPAPFDSGAGATPAPTANFLVPGVVGGGTVYESPEVFVQAQELGGEVIAQMVHRHYLAAISTNTGCACTARSASMLCTMF